MDRLIEFKLGKKNIPVLSATCDRFKVIRSSRLEKEIKYGTFSICINEKKHLRTLSDRLMITLFFLGDRYQNFLQKLKVTVSALHRMRNTNLAKKRPRTTGATLGGLTSCNASQLPSFLVIIILIEPNLGRI